MVSLLEAVNEILLASGERTVQSIGSPASLKAKDALRNSLEEILSSSDWPFTRRIVSPSTWTGDTATLENMERLLDVTYHLGYGRSFLLNQCSPDTFPITDPVEGIPSCYLLVSPTQIKFYPYPAIVDRPKLQVQYIYNVPFPVIETEQFQIPDSFYPLLIRGAMYFFAMSHLDDGASAGFYKQVFDELLNKKRLRNTNRGVGGNTIYRKRY